MTDQIAPEKAARTPLSKADVRTVLVLDEKPLCRALFARFASEAADIDHVAAAATISEATAALAAGPASLIIVDLFTSNYDFRSIKRLLDKAPTAAALAVDDRVNPAFARLSHDAGARGYVAKIQDEDAFKRAFAALARGEDFFPADMSPPARGPRPAVGLSPRQLDVLKKLAAGKSNKEIAEALGIAPGTVKLHIHAILKLTGARNRTEAALIAGRFIAPGLG